MEYTVHLGEESLEKLSKILGGESGGGETSELSIAKVTVVFNKTGTGINFPQIYVPFADEYEGEKNSAFVLGSPGDYNVILYSGKAVATIAGSLGVTITNVTSTGGITVEGGEGNYYISITGAGTLTIDYTSTGGLG